MKKSDIARAVDAAANPFGGTNGVQRETIFSKEVPLFKLAAQQSQAVELRWDFTPQERHLAAQCAQRLLDIAKQVGAVDPQFGRVDVFAVTMDLLCVHCNCVRLNLLQLLMCSGDDFTHDVLGIGMFIDRTTGKLREGFMPRNVEVRT